MMTEQQKQLQQIDLNIAFTAAMLTAVGITIYVLMGQRDMVANPKTTRFTERKLYQLGLLASLIFLITVIYFEMTAIEQYMANQTTANAEFLTATSISLVAQSIRVNALRKLNPDTQEITADEILP